LLAEIGNKYAEVVLILMAVLSYWNKITVSGQIKYIVLPNFSFHFHHFPFVLKYGINTKLKSHLSLNPPNVNLCSSSNFWTYDSMYSLVFFVSPDLIIACALGGHQR